MKVKEIDLLTIWQVFLRRFIPLLLITITFGGAAFAYTTFFVTPMYKASTLIYVYSSDRTNGSVSSSDLSASKSLVGTYIVVLKTNTVLSAVSQKLYDEYGLSYTTSEIRGMIEAAAENNTEIFRVYIENENPAIAMVVANAIADVAPGIIKEKTDAGGASVIDYATMPTTPSSPSLVKNVVISAFLGFVLSFGMFLLIEIFDTVIRIQEDLVISFGLPILGIVPELNSSDPSQAYEYGKVSAPREERKKQMKSNKYKSTVFHRIDRKKKLTPHSPFVTKEAYNSIRAQLAFTGKAEKCPCYAVTSSLPGSGKTINCVNIAISFAQMGKKVLIIDADMRNPTIHRYFHIHTDSGLSEYLAGICEVPNYISSGTDGLSVLAAGVCPPNPAELLSSSRVETLISAARAEYDIIFIDTPPINIVVDASILSERVTGYIVVVYSGRSRTYEVEQSVALLKKIGAPISGFVLNGVTSKVEKKYRNNYYRYGYRYGDKYGYFSSNFHAEYKSSSETEGGGNISGSSQPPPPKES